MNLSDSWESTWKLGITADIVARARAGDEDAWKVIVRLCAAKAYRIAFTIVEERTAAEDVVQDAMLTAFRKSNSVRELDSFEAWLYRIVVNRARDIARQRRWHASVESSIHTSPSPPATTEVIERERVRQSIGALSSDERLVIVLYYWEGYSTPEISKLIGRPVGTVRRLLSQSYAKLRLLIID